MAVSPSPNDLTRQQLDELDSLLQRMLALPVSQPEPAVAFPPPPPLPDLPPVTPRTIPRSPEPSTWRADPPEPAVSSPRTASTKLPHPAPVPEPAVAFSPSVLPFPAPPPPYRPEPPAPRSFAPTPSVPFMPPEPPPVVAPGTLRGVDAPALPFDFVPANLAPAVPPPTPEVEFAEVNPFADPPPPVVPAAPVQASGRVPVPLWPLFALNWLLEFVLGWFGPVGAVLVRPAMKTVLGIAGVLLMLGAGVWAARGMGWVSWPR